LKSPPTFTDVRERFSTLTRDRPPWKPKSTLG
jgi:hypothetical protein